jgi:hypothetical protein
MVDERRVTRVVKLAYELAQTGVFEDFAAIERELVSLGYADEAHSLEKPSIRDTLSEICITGREREEPTWHSHTSA